MMLLIAFVPEKAEAQIFQENQIFVQNTEPMVLNTPVVNQNLIQGTVFYSVSDHNTNKINTGAIVFSGNIYPPPNRLNTVYNGYISTEQLQYNSPPDIKLITIPVNQSVYRTQWKE